MHLLLDHATSARKSATEQLDISWWRGVSGGGLSRNIPSSVASSSYRRRRAGDSSIDDSLTSDSGSISVSLPGPWLENSNWRYPLLVAPGRKSKNRPKPSPPSSSTNQNQRPGHVEFESPAAYPDWTIEQIVHHRPRTNNPGYDRVRAPPNVLSVQDSRLDPYVKGLALGFIQTTVGAPFAELVLQSSTQRVHAMTQPENVATQIATTNEHALFTFGGIDVPADTVVYALVILLVTFLLITTSILTIAVVLSTETLRDVTGCFIISLSISDLISGTLITPFSLYAALDKNWRFGNSETATVDNSGFNSQDDSDDVGVHLCRIESYLEVMVWTSIVYIFMWMCVDRYTALERPSRYEVEMSATRVKCWIAFSWISAVLLGCPILAAQMKSVYYEQAFICQLDWTATTYSFSWTMAALVLLPTTASVVFVYRHIFGAMRDTTDLEDTQKMLLETDPNFMVTFFIIIAFALSWAPIFVLKASESAFQMSRDQSQVYAHTHDTDVLHFSLCWLAISAGCWKFIVCFILHPDFRAGFCSFCQILCCCCCMPSTHATSRNVTTTTGQTTTSQYDTYAQTQQQQQQQYGAYNSYNAAGTTRLSVTTATAGYPAIEYTTDGEAALMANQMNNYQSVGVQQMPLAAQHQSFPPPQQSLATQHHVMSPQQRRFL